MASRHKHRKAESKHSNGSSRSPNQREFLNEYIRTKLGIDLKATKRLGKGAFGAVYQGKFYGQDVAIKIALQNETKTLAQEVDMYRYLQSIPTSGPTSSSSLIGGTNTSTAAPPVDKASSSSTAITTEGSYLALPRVLYYSNSHDCSILVIPLMGENLNHLKDKQENRKFSIFTVLLIAYQVIRHLKYIHSRGIVHRDIKPDNMVIYSNHGQGQGMISLLDFGMSQFYLDRHGKHIPKKKRKMIDGTVRYMGKRTHEGWQGTRRDDFQALAYSLIYFLKGKLPWQGQGLSIHCHSASFNERREEIYKRKISITSDELCKGLPSIFANFLSYSNTLLFEETPDYNYWLQMFWEELKKMSDAANQVGVAYSPDWWYSSSSSAATSA